MGLLPDLSGITSGANTLSNLLLVTPKTILGYNPQNAPSDTGTVQPFQDSLVFNYEGEQTVSIESDITDHYTEANSAIQDQIAIKPETITTNGFIGELTDILPSFLGPLKFIKDKLVLLGGYAPGLTTAALGTLNQAQTIYGNAVKVKNTAVSTWNSLATPSEGNDTIIGSNGFTSKGRSQNKQQQMFQQFYLYWQQKTLFTVQTPWAVFDNMAIQSLRAIQDAETRVISNFEVTFKKIRYASTQLTDAVGLNNQFMQGRASLQGAAKQVFADSVPPLASTTLAGQTALIG